MVLKQKLSRGRQGLTNALFVCASWLIAHLLPATQWYPLALGISRLLTRTTGRFAPKGHNVNEASLTPRLLHRFLDLLSTHGTFPIPVRVEGEELLRAYAAQPGGFVCCSAHIPFLKLFFPVARRVLGDARPRSIIAREPVGDNMVTIWNDVPWKAIRTDHATLLHSRSLLRQNGCLVVVVDKEQGEFISSNIFRFAGKMNARILMWFLQLQPNGEILLSILQPPGPACKTEQEIRANLDFVAENVRRILHGGQIAPANRMQSAMDESSEAQRSREINRIQLYSNAQLDARMRRLQAVLAQPNGTSEHERQRKLLEERLSLMQLEFETRTGV